MSQSNKGGSASPTSPIDDVAKKRKRISAAEPEELEIDVNLPEPPSKKAKRKADRISRKSGSSGPSALAGDLKKAHSSSDAAQSPRGPAVVPQKRSEHGVWIGNLPFAATADTVRQFLEDHAAIEAGEVVRLNLPAPNDKAGRAKNKGFCYVDFANGDAVGKAIAVSEKLMGGRRLLIKDSKSFEGRPEPKAATENGGASGGMKKEPTKRVFVGNLGFDVTKEDVETHFGQAGEVEDCFLATFEDSGKCKGFGWVRFATLEASEAAVRGYIRKRAEEDGDEDQHDDDDDDDDDDNDDGNDGNDENGTDHVADARVAEKDADLKAKKKTKDRKWFINRLYGRALRCEFAEDAQTRYQKRFGKKDGNRSAPPFGYSDPASTIEGVEAVGKEAARPSAHNGVKPAKTERRQGGAEERREQRRRRHDARTVAPGKALATTQRATAAIVQGTGKKVTFD